jgi:hypothetical protein
MHTMIQVETLNENSVCKNARHKILYFSVKETWLWKLLVSNLWTHETIDNNCQTIQNLEMIGPAIIFFFFVARCGNHEAADTQI